MPLFYAVLGCSFESESLPGMGTESLVEEFVFL